MVLTLCTYIEIATSLLWVKFIGIFGGFYNRWIESHKVFSICIKMVDNWLRPLMRVFDH